MAIFNITDMKVVAPSPCNFILKLQLDNNEYYNFIASGEQIYVNKDTDNNASIDKDLLEKHVAHSSIFKTTDSDTPITAFSLFDMNDVCITTHDYDEDSIDNMLLLPNANNRPTYKVNYDIPMHVINSNAVYGYIETFDKSFGFPHYSNSKSFIMSTHNANASCNSQEVGRTDTMTLYHYNRNATNVSSLLGLGFQDDISSDNTGFDKVFVFDPTNSNTFDFTDFVSLRNSFQINKAPLTQEFIPGINNNFDNGTLIARAILFPKQTLNNEYSTERNYISSVIPNTEPYNYVRKYNWNDEYFYSNGTSIIFNHRDENRFAYAITSKNEHPESGTMVTSTYSSRLGRIAKIHSEPTTGEIDIYQKSDDESPEYKKETDYNTYNTFEISASHIEDTEGLFSQYSPEIFNRKNETMSDTSLVTSKHKTNVFDIEFSSLWKDICNNFTPSDENAEAYAEIKNNLKRSIKNNLFKLVEEIKPVHTALYKITMDD